MIAILFDKNNRITDFYNLNSIKIFKKKDNEFKIIKEITDISADTSNMNALRKFLNNLCEEFGASKVIVGSQIVGIPFHFFLQKGYEICEADKFSEELLCQIYDDLIEHQDSKKQASENELEKTEAAKTPIAPIAIDDEGNYFFDFIRVQKYRPEITSKKALLSFLSNQLYQTLTILCSHIMPWIENYLAQNENLEYSTKREDGVYTIIISHKVCVNV